MSRPDNIHSSYLNWSFRRKTTDFRIFFEEEKAHFAKAYCEKLEQELRVISLMNGPSLPHPHRPSHTDLPSSLKEEVIAQGIELQRCWIREVKLCVEEERGGRLAKLNELAANLKHLERVVLDNSTYLDENLHIHALWSALRTVSNSIDALTRRPFRDELCVLRHAAAAWERDHDGLTLVITTAEEMVHGRDSGNADANTYVYGLSTVRIVY